MSADVCVFVLVYNDEEFGPRAVESVLDQTYKNIDIKILENGSTDNTRERLERFKKDPRVTIYNHNINLRSEFCTKMALADDHEYFSFLFSDDYYHPSRIETCLNGISGKDAVFSNNDYVDQFNQSLETIPNYIPRCKTKTDLSCVSQYEILRHIFSDGNPLHPCSMLIKGSTYKRLGGFRGHLHRIGDMVFFTKLFAQASVNMISPRLQAITVFTDKRNAGAMNAASDPEGLLFERQLMLEEFKKKPLIDNLDKIFTSKYCDDPGLLSDAGKLWFLAQQALRVKAIDYRLFGAKCLYEAAEIDEGAVNRISLSAFGHSFGTYMELLPSGFCRYLHDSSREAGSEGKRRVRGFWFALGIFFMYISENGVLKLLKKSYMVFSPKKLKKVSKRISSHYRSDVKSLV